MEDVADRKPPGTTKVRDDDLLMFTKTLATGIQTPHLSQKAVEFAPNSSHPSQGASNSTNLTLDPNILTYSTPQQVPGSIFTTAHKDKLEKAYDPNKKYKLFIASNEATTLDRHCLCLIRGGFAFCINYDCSLSHAGNKLDVPPAQAYIKRSQKQAFIEPSVNTARFDFHLLDSWMDMAYTLVEWAELFQLAESAMVRIDEREITETDLHNEKLARSKALKFRSAKKRKPSSFPALDSITFHFDKVEPGISIDSLNLKEMILNIQDALRRLSIFVRCLHDEHLGLSSNNNISMLSHEEQINSVARELGKISSNMLSELDAPTIWSTIALVGSKLSALTNDLDSKVIESVKRLKPNDDLITLRVVEPQLQKLDDRVDLLKKAIFEIGNTLHQQIGAVVNTQPTPVRHNFSSVSAPIDVTWKSGIDKDLKMLKTLADTEAIRFNSLAFKTLRESIDWLKAHSPKLDFGHVVDAHIVLGYLFRDIETGGSDFLQSQLLLAKNKLSNAHEGCTITSFERSNPRLFLKSGKIRLIRNDKSYFDTMPRYKDWKTSETGYRDYLTEALKTYKSTHIQFLRAELEPNTPMFQSAYESVLFTVNWLEDFVRYIDETYEEYTETRLNKTKAWSITTILARALLNDIAKPRNSIRSSLKTQNKKQMKRVSFYGSLQSLDRMMAISDVGFKNSPIVSNELVKVLAKNTNIAAIEKLQNEFTTLQHENHKLRNELADVKAKANEAIKIANAANNKSDAAKNDVASL